MFVADAARHDNLVPLRRSNAAGARLAVPALPTSAWPTSSPDPGGAEAQRRGRRPANQRHRDGRQRHPVRQRPLLGGTRAGSSCRLDGSWCQARRGPHVDCSLAISQVRTPGSAPSLSRPGPARLEEPARLNKVIDPGATTGAGRTRATFPRHNLSRCSHNSDARRRHPEASGQARTPVPAHDGGSCPGRAGGATSPPRQSCARVCRGRRPRGGVVRHDIQPSARAGARSGEIASVRKSTEIEAGHRDARVAVREAADARTTC